MSAHADAGEAASYPFRFYALVWLSVAQLLRPVSHPRRTEASRRLARHTLWLAAAGGLAIAALMVGLDAREIALMPPRGTPDLWPFRVITDFGKAAYVLWALAGLLFAVAVVAPALRGARRSHWLRFGTRVQFLFFCVALPDLAGELVKWIVGRGRPYVGHDGVFTFAHFSGTEAYASFPSGHAVTSAALAFAVSAVWPRARAWMIAYALLIIGSRLVLLAHHPSDVTAGAILGVIGAMTVRYWFAARRLGFDIGSNGAIAVLDRPGRQAKGLPARLPPHNKRAPQSLR